jgi:hypothetical protein
VCVREREGVCVCERERVCVCERERERERTIVRVLKTSNKETFLHLCEIMAVHKVLSGFTHGIGIWNLMKGTEIL